MAWRLSVQLSSVLEGFVCAGRSNHLVQTSVGSREKYIQPQVGGCHLIIAILSSERTPWNMVAHIGFTTARYTIRQTIASSYSLNAQERSTMYKLTSEITPPAASPPPPECGMLVSNRGPHLPTTSTSVLHNRGDDAGTSE